jgi:hypothetical protein
MIDHHRIACLLGCQHILNLVIDSYIYGKLCRRIATFKYARSLLIHAAMMSYQPGQGSVGQLKSGKMMENEPGRQDSPACGDRSMRNRGPESPNRGLDRGLGIFVESR